MIQLPCLNEAETLPAVYKEIPQNIKDIGRIETLVIDDGSTDGTGDVARQLGVNHIIRFTNRKGLAKAFITGIDASLKLGADIIVNLDGDGQYDPQDIPKLIRPILEEKADMVIGNRNVDKLSHFSFTKKKLQKLGSWVVRRISNTRVPDVTSGFRAFSRQAALSINVISNFTYTLETLIQAGSENVALADVEVKARPVARKSRLFKTISAYVKKSIATIIRIYTMYKPLQVFSFAAGIIFVIGILFFAKFLQFHIEGTGTRHIQYLIVSAVAMLLGFQTFMIGLVADLIAANRKLVENTLRRVKNLELSK
ncbi:glycosyltransferase family 2 protein [Candidatus Omnitrophota bacterium]